MAENLYDEMKKHLSKNDDEMVMQFVQRRFIPITGKITDEIAKGIIPVLARFDLMSHDPITLLIASNGGDIEAAGYIIDMIHGINSPVDGLVTQRAGSAAVDILLHCRKRMALPHSWFFVHFTRCGFDVVCDSDRLGKHDFRAFRKKILGAKREREQLYSMKLGKSLSEVRKLFHMGEKFHLEYSTDEALKLGLIGEVNRTFKFVLPKIS